MRQRRLLLLPSVHPPLLLPVGPLQFRLANLPNIRPLSAGRTLTSNYVRPARRINGISTVHSPISRSVKHRMKRRADYYGNEQGAIDGGSHPLNDPHRRLELITKSSRRRRGSRFIFGQVLPNIKSKR